MSLVEQKIRIMLAEDHLLLRTAMRFVLNKFPHMCVVSEVADGQAALKEALVTTPDVILMDINLPIIDGIKATELIKCAVPSTKILMLTANESMDSYQQAMSAGASGYCLKDLPTIELVWVITNVIDTNLWNNLGLSKSIMRGATVSLQVSIQDSEFDKILAGPKTLHSASANDSISQNLNLFFSSTDTLFKEIDAAAEMHDGKSLNAISDEITAASSRVGALTLARISEQVKQDLVDNKWKEAIAGFQLLKSTFQHVKSHVKKATDYSPEKLSQVHNGAINSPNR